MEKFNYMVYDNIDQMYCAGFHYEKEAKAYVGQQQVAYGNNLTIVENKSYEAEQHCNDGWHKLEDCKPEPWSEVLIRTFDGFLEVALYKTQDLSNDKSKCDFYIKDEDYLYDEYISEAEIYMWHDIPKFPDKKEVVE